MVLALLEFGPEILVVLTPRLKIRYKQAMVLPDDFIELIPDNLEKIRVGAQDCTIHLKFDHSLGTAYRIELIPRLCQGRHAGSAGCIVGFAS
jgi:hypothetical protein